MPGYGIAAEHFGEGAEAARAAEELRRTGDVCGAIAMLEETLEVCARSKPELPAWLVGRLAMSYRTARRYEDEVNLLLRYRDSQTADSERSRYDARLTKALALEERSRRNTFGALTSLTKLAGPKRPSNRSAR
jgi:hypothetical protein